MVKQVLALGALGLLLTGCADEVEKNSQKSAPLSIEAQIQQIEKTPGMPEDVKARTIASLRQQAAAKKGG